MIIKIILAESEGNKPVQSISIFRVLIIEFFLFASAIGLPVIALIHFLSTRLEFKD